MTEDQKRRQEEYRKEFLEFRAALNVESDRGCVLFAAAYLDTALGEMLASSFVQNSKVTDDLLGSQRPLGSFSARITAAYYLGKISATERKDFETIRSIRNDFAHKSFALDFDTQSIRDRCTNLLHTWASKESRPRSHFTGAVSGLLARLRAVTLQTKPFIEQREIPLTDELKVHIRRTAAEVSEAAYTATRQSETIPEPAANIGDNAYKILADLQALDRFRAINATPAASSYSRERELDLYASLDAELGIELWKNLFAFKTIGADEEALLSEIREFLARKA